MALIQYAIFQRRALLKVEVPTIHSLVTDSAAKLLEAPHDFEVDATNQEKYNVLWNVIIKHHIVWISHEINRCEIVCIRYY